MPPIKIGSIIQQLYQCEEQNLKVVGVYKNSLAETIYECRLEKMNYYGQGNPMFFTTIYIPHSSVTEVLTEVKENS